jgi:hypothetical protein
MPRGHGGHGFGHGHSHGHMGHHGMRMGASMGMGMGMGIDMKWGCREGVFSIILFCTTEMRLAFRQNWNH